MKIYKFNKKQCFLDCKPTILSPIQAECMFMGKDSNLYLYRYGIESVHNKLVIIYPEDMEQFDKMFVNKDVSFIDLINIKTIDELLLAYRLLKDL